MSGRSSAVGGRVIRQRIDVSMSPQHSDVIGATDAASALGQELLRTAINGLRTAAEAEGFVVEVDVSQVVY